MNLEIAIEDPRWSGLETLLNRTVPAVLDHFGLDPEPVEISVLGCDDDRIAALNTEFRNKPAPTNVLSWPAEDLAAELEGNVPALPTVDYAGEMALGDLAISFDTCAREANEAGKPMVDHVMHLLVHGMLHLLGYDHIRDRDATLMEGIEVEILGNLGIDDPYKD